MNKIIYTVVAVVILIGGVVLYIKMSPFTESSSSTVASEQAEAMIGDLYGNAVPPTGSSTGASSAPADTSTAPLKATTATIKTNKGDITIAFAPEIAPNTVANFVKLAEAGFYNGTKFHRVIKGFMNQGGDPLSKDDSKAAAWGTGGPGYKFNDEITAESRNVAGTVAMANSGPNTNGSQFFINVVDNAFLDGNYTVFATVTKGMDVALAINSVKTDGNDRPLQPVVVSSVTVK